MHERRRHRSEIPAEALSMYLTAVLERQGLDAITLANDDGLLIAAAARPGAPVDLEWIAALGCVCAVPGRRGPSLGALVERSTGGRPLATAELALRGERLYLTTVGGPLPAGPEVSRAVDRILHDALPAAA